MLKCLRKFLSCENGAVTVDWVVLTGAIVGLSIGLIAKLSNETWGLGTEISDYVANRNVGD